jgi:hypothetical protein
LRNGRRCRGRRAATLGDVLDFYDQRFNLNLTDQQKSDLIAFLQTL